MPTDSGIRRGVRTVATIPRFARHLPAALAVFGLVWTALTIDPSGSYPALGEGPGLTVDEVFNVQQGVFLVTALREYGIGILDPQSIREVYTHPAHLPDHPPLGRLWLGMTQQTVASVFPPAEPVPLISTAAARFAPATAFALTIWLAGFMARRWYGDEAGAIAAACVLLSPRLFAHAHIAALESFINLAYLAAVVVVADRWQAGKPVGWKTVALSGLVFGLALLTKIQAVLLPIPIAAWALWHWRVKGGISILIWGLTGTAVLFVGWPWLWLDPVEHFLQYLGRTTDRAVLHTYYFGQVLDDRDVPWHYPWIMFLATTPVLTHALACTGLLGSGRWKTDARLQLLLATAMFPLVIFSLPGTAVYDGMRLFSVSLPLWAMIAGCGGGLLWQRLEAHVGARRSALFALALVMLHVAVQGGYHPYQLSYYNGLVGGLRGAAALGMERTYWSDSITRGMLDEIVRQVPENSVIAVGPTLHPFQLEEMLTQSPLLRRHGVKLVPLDEQTTAAYVLTFERRADLSPEWWSDRDPAEVVIAEELQGVRVATLYRR